MTKLLKIPAEPSPELLIPGAAAQTRVVSLAGIRLESWECARAFKGIICADVSEIAVGTLITGRPPHRSVQAQFGHTAPTLGVTAKPLRFAVCAPTAIDQVCRLSDKARCDPPNKTYQGLPPLPVPSPRAHGSSIINSSH